MEFKPQQPQPSLKETVETKRTASYEGYDSLLKNLPLGMLAEIKTGGVYISNICREVNIWAQTYRGYKDEDKTYELVTKLAGKIVAYAESKTLSETNRDKFIEEIYKIIDQTFPII